MALAWAVFVGGVLQLAFQLPWLAKLGFLKMPKLSFKDAAVNRVMKQMGPAILGVSVAQISGYQHHFCLFCSPAACRGCITPID